jgi:hypothetical protein
MNNLTSSWICNLQMITNRLVPFETIVGGLEPHAYDTEWHYNYLIEHSNQIDSNRPIRGYSDISELDAIEKALEFRDKIKEMFKDKLGISFEEWVLTLPERPLTKHSRLVK